MDRPVRSRWRRLAAAAIGLLVGVNAAVVGVAVVEGFDDKATTVAGTVVTRRVIGAEERRPAPPTHAPIDDPMPVRVRAAPVSRPASPPADPYVAEPVVVIGQITIPKLGIDAPLHEGISLTVIDRGPSHWPGTAMPGEIGNVVVAGHRVTKTRPFRHIDALTHGDEVIFTVDGRRSVYRVTATDVVTPDALHIVEQTREPTATLFACHPPGSARYRYVVRLALDREASDVAPA